MATTVDIATSVVTCVAMETMTDIKQKQNPIKTAIINKVTCLLLYEQPIKGQQKCEQYGVFVAQIYYIAN